MEMIFYIALQMENNFVHSTKKWKVSLGNTKMEKNNGFHSTLKMERILCIIEAVQCCLNVERLSKSML